MDKQRDVSVLVTVDDATHDLNKVAASLKKAGLRSLQVMPLSGIIGGTVAPKTFDKLSKVKGVIAVEPESTMQAFE